MDWFLYDIGLCHERVNDLPDDITCMPSIYRNITITSFRRLLMYKEKGCSKNGA